MNSARRHEIIREGRVFFGKHLANTLKHRHDYAEILGSLERVQELEFALGGAAAILFTEASITSFMGVFSSGKSALLTRHLLHALPSGRSPTSRLYAIIEPVENLDRQIYGVGYLGETEAQRCLALIAEKMPGRIAEAAKTAITLGESVRDAALKQYRCYIANYQLAQSEDDQQNVADAAFLTRSIVEHLGNNQTLITRPLVNNADFTDREQAAHYVAWDDDLSYDLGNPSDGRGLEQAIDTWFRGDRWSEFERRNQHRRDLKSMRQVYQIGLQLGVLAFLWCQVPANETLRAGFLYADAPGRGGTSLLDTIMGDLVLRSASAGNFVIRMDRPGGKEQRALAAKLETMPCGRTYNFADALLTEEEADGEASDEVRRDREERKGLATAVAGLAYDATAFESAQKIVTAFASQLGLDRPDSKNYCRFNAEDPNQTSLVQLTYAKFGKDSHRTSACQRLRTLARWLGDPAILDDLPDHLKQIVSLYSAQSLPEAMQEIVPHLPSKIVARLMAILVALGHDGGKSSMAPLLREVQRDIDRARFQKWTSSADKIKSLMAGLGDFPFDEVSEMALGREQKEEILALSAAIQSAVAQTKDMIQTDLGLRHFCEPLEEPVRMHLTALCKEGSKQLASESARKTLRLAHVRLFQQVVQDLPHRLDLSIDDAVASFLERVQSVVPQGRFTFDGSEDQAASGNGKGNGKPKNGAAAPPETLRARIVAALLPASSFWRCAQLRPRLRHNVDECVEQCWSRLLLKLSPMLSIPDEPFDRDAHPKRFESIAFRVGEHVMTTALIAAGRDLLATTRTHLLEWLARLEERTRYPALVEQAILASADNPEALAQRRRALACQAFYEFQRDLPAMLAQIDHALEPANGRPSASANESCPSSVPDTTYQGA